VKTKKAGRQFNPICIVLRDLPEYIQISIKKPRQKTIRSDHFFFWDITITSPFVSVSESFLSGTVDLVGPADIDLARVTSESTIVFVGDSSRGVWLGKARDGIIGSIAGRLRD